MKKEQKVNEKAGTFVTPDLNLAAFFQCHGLEAELSLSDNWVKFSFLSSPQLTQLLVQFNSDYPTPILQYLTSYRLLKARMIALKGGGRT